MTQETRIFIVDDADQGKICINANTEFTINKLLSEGAYELSPELIEQYGMKGHEDIVCPDNTTVNADGTITFHPTPLHSKEDLFRFLRDRRDLLLKMTDFSILEDSPFSEEQKSMIKEYRRRLRELPQQEGAPWDGGGSDTPWPDVPDFIKSQTR